MSHAMPEVATSSPDRLRDMCTLSNEQLAVRLTDIRRDILPHVRHTSKRADGYVLELTAAPGLREKIERVIALEQKCCAGMQMRLSETSQAPGLQLEVSGVDPESGILVQLFGQAPAETPAVSDKKGLRSLLSSAGIGVVSSVFFLCVLPIGLAGLLGASATAYLTKLDSLPVIAIAAFAFGGAAWWWQRRPNLKGTEKRGHSCGC